MDYKCGRSLIANLQSHKCVFSVGTKENKFTWVGLSDWYIGQWPIAQLPCIWSKLPAQVIILQLLHNLICMVSGKQTRFINSLVECQIRKEICNVLLQEFLVIACCHFSCHHSKIDHVVWFINDYENNYMYEPSNLQQIFRGWQNSTTPGSDDPSVAANVAFCIPCRDIHLQRGIYAIKIIH